MEKSIIVFHLPLEEEAKTKKKRKQRKTGWKETSNNTHLFLLNPQCPRPLPLARLLLLIPLIEARGILQRPAQIIRLLDLIDPDDPVLAGESLVERTELGALGGQFGAADAVLSLARGEERVVVVVAHLVHQAVLHGVGGAVVDAVLAARREEVALFHFVGPDACVDGCVSGIFQWMN